MESLGIKGGELAAIHCIYRCLVDFKEFCLSERKRT